MNERTAELETLHFIYPELEVDGNTARLDLLILLPSPLSVIASPNSKDSPEGLRRHEVMHLPAVHISFDLPDGYPTRAPPSVNLQATWLPEKIKSELQFLAMQLWEEYGGAEILFAYISQLQEAAEGNFGLDHLSVSEDSLNKLVEHDRRARREEFQKSSHECSICLDPKPGPGCYRMERCGHIFCVECLQEYYNSAIEAGQVDDIQCLSPNCGTEHLDARARRAKKIRHICPRELLQVPIERVKVQRYVDMKRKKRLEANRSTVWCPRQFCQGAAKGSKYPKPTVPLEEMEVSDTEDEENMNSDVQNISHDISSASQKDDGQGEDRLAICEDCEYAFCTVCHATWHGPGNGCYTLEGKEKMLTKEQLMKAEEEASLAYIATETSNCPKCKTPVQKTEACNHITCSQCRSHFCYLCCAYLNPTWPYSHFSIPGLSCFEKLWAVPQGVDNTGQYFGGARGAEIRARQVEEEVRRAEEEEERRREELLRERIRQANGS